MNWSGIPAGFVPLQSDDAFEADIGPLYSRPMSEDIEVGFLVADHHLGPNGCHGGMLCSVAEIVISTQLRHRLGAGERFQVISLNSEFLGPAPLGSWISGRADILRVTKNFVFTTVILVVANTLVLRASGLVGRAA